jgi:hypothetical protein
MGLRYRRASSKNQQHTKKGDLIMKRALTLLAVAAITLSITGAAQASGDEGYEYGHRYGSGYGYNDDMYEYGRGRVSIPAYSNVVPTVVYPPANISNYRSAVPYYGHEGYEYSGRYGYGDDDMYEYRGGYRGHE